MTRWPTKPRPEDICDLHTGSGFDSCGAPIVYRCQNKAVETVKHIKYSHYTVYICTDCLEKSKDQFQRNPRLTKS